MIFEVTPEQIERLSDEDLRTLVGLLAEQEVVRAGHSPSGVTYGGNQNAKDGGVDVRVDLGSAPIKGYIARPQTGYQVKAANMPKAAIEAEMRPGGKLRPSIVKLGERDGAYIIVSSKGSLADTALSQRRNAMANAIADEPSASTLHLDFYDRSRLASWVNQHPGLVPWVKKRVGLPLSGWRPYDDWSSSPGNATEQYLTDEHIRVINVRFKDKDGLSATVAIEKLREVLARPEGAARLVGLSGVGKTRLVQALFDATIGSNALSPQFAVYADLADSPNPTPLDLLGHLLHLGQRCVLIIDNCGADLHRKLCARLRTAQGAVSLITVEYDIRDDEPEGTETFKLEPSSREVIEKIVARRYPKLVAPEIRTIAAFSEGNSRIALALAETAQHGESLANLQDSGLIRRLFHQNHQEDPVLLRAAKACSLVYSFDGETLAGNDAELSRIAALAGQSVDELHGHVAELMRRQLIQKRSTWRALLPHALAHKLAKEALEDVPLERVRKHLIDGAPARFLKSFSRRLGCLHDSSEARHIVAEWLGKNGALADVESLDDLGITVLENVAPVNPSAIMEALERAIKPGEIATGQRDRLHRFADILRSLAYDPDTFERALNLITFLAENEPESNNTGAAVNVFKSLFFLYLSGTHASAKQRADFLRALAASKMTHGQVLVLAGLDAMLECTHFSSSYGFEFGTRKRDYGFHPKSKDEFQAWYRETFSLVGELAGHNYLRVPVRKMVASQFRLLAAETRLTDELVALADRLAADGGWPEGWAGVRSALGIAKKSKRKLDAEKFEALEGRLKPVTLEARIATYVLPERWGTLDFAEMELEDENRYEKARKKVDAICADIGRELAADLPTLAHHLPAMLGSSSGRGSTVAAAIGRETQEPRKAWELVLAEVLSPARNDKFSDFPAAFVCGLAKVNKPLCEALLDESLANAALHPHFVVMQAWAGIDKAGCRRLIEAAKHVTIPVGMFRQLSNGRACDDLSAADFKALLLAVASRDGGLEAALDILVMRLHSKGAEKQALEAEEMDAGRALLGRVMFEGERKREASVLGELVRKCLRSPVDDVLADQICERLLQGIAHSHVFASDYGELVVELGATFPRSLLNILVEKAPLALEGRRGVFSGFRERRPCPLSKIPDDVLLEWANERPERRFLQLAEVMRPWRRIDRTPSNDDEDDGAGLTQWTSVALRILHEAPEPSEILSQYVKHFHPGGWSGSLASILESRVPLLETLCQDSNPTIASAAKQALGAFKQSIEKERRQEAQESRERDERFEW